MFIKNDKYKFYLRVKYQDMKENIQNKIIILIVGIAGSGKTTLAYELAHRILNGVFMSKDFIQDAFSTAERGGKIYENIRGPTFEILVNFAKLQIMHGKIPIIDAPFSRNHHLTDKYRDWVNPFKKVALENHARLLIIRCIPPNHNELKSRLSKRGNEYDKWKLKNFEAFLKHEPINFPIPHDDIVELVTDKPPAILATNVLQNYLNNDASI